MKKILVVLKSLNLISVTIYSFALIFVLSRSLPVEYYPAVIFVASIGNYVLVTDLGFSGYVYADVREQFLKGSLSERFGFISNSIACYLAIAILAAIVAAGCIALFMSGTPVLKAAVALFFTSIVLGLPWQLIRRIASAVDLLVEFELVELVRRLLVLALTGSMLIGVSFLLYSLLMVAVWAIAFVIAYRMLTRKGLELRGSRPRELVEFFRSHRSKMLLTGGFTLQEFLIYNFPYIFAPLLSGGTANVVSFDLFYKVCRFGGVSYSVSLDTYLPFQTRAYYANDIRTVRRYRWAMAALGSIPFIAAAIFLTFYGDYFFNILLDGKHPISNQLEIMMIAMLGFNLLQTTSATFVLAIGRFAMSTKLTMVTMVLMATVAATSYWLNLDFDTFLAAYVAVYAVHALMFMAMFTFVTKSAKPS